MKHRMRRNFIVNDKSPKILNHMNIKYSKTLFKIFARNGYENDEELNSKCLVFKLE
jgi:predicted fused transcriptional regulator/phosphomethylpyrimidine kinase